MNPPTVGLYACPICSLLLPREATDSGDLTLEHVPPEPVGGKGIVLTCKQCNSTAGHTVDAALTVASDFLVWEGRCQVEVVSERYREHYARSDSASRVYQAALTRRLVELQREHGFPVLEGMRHRQETDVRLPRRNSARLQASLL